MGTAKQDSAHQSSTTPETLTMDDLLRYSAADLDPYTVAIGQQLCGKFVFSQLGHRNLTTAFDSLPGKHYSVDVFEIGYGAYHVLPILLQTDSGFALAAVIGSLAEYFREEVVVSFLMLLTEGSGVPVAQRPLEHQWSRLVDVFYGVLSTSVFGSLLSDLEDKLPAVEGEIDAKGLLKAFTGMSEAVRDRDRTVALSASAGYVWLAGVANWLFDLKFTVRSTDSQVIYTYPRLDSSSEARVVFTHPSSVANITAKSSRRPDSTANHLLNGGRVSFEQFFQSCFGDTAAVLREKALAASVCCGLIIIGTALQTSKNSLSSVFLPPDGTKPGPETPAFRDLLLGWFPELRRRSTHFNRYDKLTSDEAHALYDDAILALAEQCTCASCTPDDSLPNIFCNVTLAEFIITLSLYISPMVVAPKLYPKRNGVLAMYEQCHQTRLSHLSTAASSVTPSQAFVSTLESRLPSAASMLRTSTLLFANTTPSTLDLTTNVMGLTSTGLTVFLTSFKQVHSNSSPSTSTSLSTPKDKIQEDRVNVSVMVSPGWMCLFGHETRLEIYEPTYMKWDFVRQWQEATSHNSKLQQIVKWRGRVMITSVVYQGSREEKMAEDDGWILLK